MFLKKCLVCGSVFMTDGFLCSECSLLTNKDRFESFMIRCGNCFYPIVSEDYICPRCHCEKNYNPIYSIYDYSAVFSRRLLERFKFEGERKLKYYWAECLKRCFDDLDLKTEDSVIVPVPCSSSGLKRRGWDHMVEISGVLSHKYNFTCRRMIKNISSNIGEQKNMNLKERKENAQKKFAPDNDLLKSALPDLTYILLDDIFTTGSTIHACEQILNSAGLKKLKGITLFLEL